MSPEAQTKEAPRSFWAGRAAMAESKPRAKGLLSAGGLAGAPFLTWSVSSALLWHTNLRLAL